MADNSTVEQNKVAETSDTSVSHKPQKVRLSRNVLIILGLLIIIPVFLFGLSSFGKKTSDTKSPSEENLLATVAGTYKIYRNTVVETAEKNYASSAITDDVLEDYLDIVIERAILDEVAKKEGLEGDRSGTTEDYYQSLRKQVIQTQVDSVLVDIISYWVPPPRAYQQRPEFAEQRRVGALAMEQAKIRLENGEDALQIAQSISRTYAQLRPIIALNGWLVDELASDTPLDSPMLYEYRGEKQGEYLFDALFAQPEGTVQTYQWPDESGGAAIKSVEVNQKNKIDYPTWLSQKKDELVVFTDNKL